VVGFNILLQLNKESIMLKLLGQVGDQAMLILQYRIALLESRVRKDSKWPFKPHPRDEAKLLHYQERLQELLANKLTLAVVGLFGWWAWISLEDNDIKLAQELRELHNRLNGISTDRRMDFTQGEFGIEFGF
jgi:hypothetical protein